MVPKENINAHSELLILNPTLDLLATMRTCLVGRKPNLTSTGGVCEKSSIEELSLEYAERDARPSWLCLTSKCSVAVPEEIPKQSLMA